MRRPHLLAVAVLAVLVLAGCTVAATGSQPTPTPSGLETLRTDPEPIRTRWPALGDFVQVHWVAWYHSDPRVPGPNAFDIQALVVLSPEDAAAVQAGYDWQPAPTDVAATMCEELRPYAPTSGDWRQADDFDDALAAGGNGALAYVETTTGTVYLQARLE